MRTGVATPRLPSALILPAAMLARRFPIRLGKRSRPLLRLFGVRGENAYVDLDDPSLWGNQIS